MDFALILDVIPSIVELGMSALIIIVMGFIVWKMFKVIEKKDSVFLDTVRRFEQSVKEEGELNRKSRKKDAEQTQRAVDNLSDLVKFIHSNPD